LIDALKLALAAATVVTGIAQPPKPMPAGLKAPARERAGCRGGCPRRRGAGSFASAADRPGVTAPEAAASQVLLPPPKMP
jgi:hypothetical protein